jgi:transcriptional regulator with XRE-family HTH domain
MFGPNSGAYESGRDEPGWAALCRLAQLFGRTLFPPGPGQGPPRPRPAGHATRLGRPVAVALPCRECGATVTTGSAQVRNNGPALCLACLARHPDASFGDRLKAHRLAAGPTLMALAARAGIRFQNLSAYECGVAEPKWRTLVRLVAVLGPGLATLRPEGRPGPNRAGRAERR